MKEQIKPLLEGLGLEIRDVGVYEEKPADYPDIACKVADLVVSGVASGHYRGWRGIGSCMAANKFRAFGQPCVMIKLPPEQPRT